MVKLATVINANFLSKIIFYKIINVYLLIDPNTLLSQAHVLLCSKEGKEYE